MWDDRIGNELLSEEFLAQSRLNHYYYVIVNRSRNQDGLIMGTGHVIMVRNIRGIMKNDQAKSKDYDQLKNSGLKLS